MVEMIATVLDNGVISVNGKIPVLIPMALSHFIEKIRGKVIVMGSKTFESLGGVPFSVAKEAVVLTRNNIHRRSSKVIVKTSLVDIMESYKDFIVIGGASVFADFMPIADKIYITEVSEVAEKGENFKLFPRLTNFKLTNPSTEMLVEKDHYFRFLIYERK